MSVAFLLATVALALEPDAPVEAPASAPPGAEASAPPGAEASAPPGAEASPATRWVGMPVVQRALVAPDGGLPEESLEPLLRVQQDSLYSPADVRLDLAMLHRALDFAQVEVDVEPWVGFAPDGSAVPGVRVEYRVWPPPRLVRIAFAGNRALSRRNLEGASGIAKGDPFFPDDALVAERAIRDAYAKIGYPRAAVSVTTASISEGKLALRIDVTEGEPQRLAELNVRRGDAISALQADWVLARAGLRTGRPWTDARVRDAREALTRAVRARGYFAARVGVRADPVSPESDRIAFVVDPRQRWEIERAGRGLPSRREIEEILALDEAPRLGRNFAEDAGETLTEHLRRKGFLEAAVRVELVEDDAVARIRVTGDAGARHRLRSVVFEGEPVWSQKYLEQALREASPEMLGRRRVTPEAVDRALRELEEFYRSQGYLSAKLERLAFVEGPDAKVVVVDVRVGVVAGPRTTLRTLDVGEPTAGVEARPFFEDLQGRPLNPAEVDARCRKLVEALNEAGYLSADARAHTTLDAEGTGADVRIEVTAGPLVYLRTVVLRGYRRTRRSVIEREVDLRPGDPLAPSRVTAVRRQLYELEVFRRVSAELVGDEDRVKDLFIEVEEKPNLHFEVGGGVATDEGLKVFARAGHRNLGGLGHRLTLLGQVGIGWVGDGFVPDWAGGGLSAGPEWKAAARYEAPHIPGRGERVAIDVLFNEQQQETTFRLERTGGAVGVLLLVGEHGTAELAYRVQARRLLDVDPGALVVGDPWFDELTLTGTSDFHPVVPSLVRTQSGLDLSFLYDRRDDVFNPTKGGVGSFQVVATDRLLSDVSFLKGEGSWTQWVPVAGFGLQLRLRGGAAWLPGEGETLPVEDRFRLGGGANLRGFEVDSAGPVNEVAPEAIDYPDAIDPLMDYSGRAAPARWVPTGGDALALGSVEFRIPFEKLGLVRWAGTQLAFFADAGNVWFVEPGVDASSTLDAGDPLLRWSVGLGLRRTTVIGPVQIDLGFNPRRIAGRDEDLVRVHVSLGAL